MRLVGGLLQTVLSLVTVVQLPGNAMFIGYIVIILMDRSELGLFQSEYKHFIYIL